LQHDGDFGFIVVHGHTPVMAPDLRRNRINIDTGAFATNRLTCLRIGEDGARLLEECRGMSRPAPSVVGGRRSSPRPPSRGGRDGLSGRAKPAAHHPPSAASRWVSADALAQLKRSTLGRSLPAAAGREIGWVRATSPAERWVLGACPTMTPECMDLAAPYSPPRWRARHWPRRCSSLVKAHKTLSTTAVAGGPCRGRLGWGLATSETL
jgi:hypothetical protein